MTRIEEIRKRVEAFKFWKLKEHKGDVNYLETMGPDFEYLLFRLDIAERALSELKEHLELALSFCPKGPVQEGLDPTFYHTLEYNEELKLQKRIDAAREALEKMRE